MLGAIHPAVGLAQQSLGIGSVGAEDSAAYTKSHHALAANVHSSFNHKPIQVLNLDLGGSRGKSWHDEHEFVAAHAGDIVVASTGSLEFAGNVGEQLIAHQVAEAVVHLLKTVQVANQNGQRHAVPAGAANFTVQVHEQGTGVGQGREIV